VTIVCFLTPVMVLAYYKVIGSTTAIVLAGIGRSGAGAVLPLVAQLVADELLFLFSAPPSGQRPRGESRRGPKRVKARVRGLLPPVVALSGGCQAGGEGRRTLDSVLDLAMVAALDSMVGPSRFSASVSSGSLLFRVPIPESGRVVECA